MKLIKIDFASRRSSGFPRKSLFFAYEKLIKFFSLKREKMTTVVHIQRKNGKVVQDCDIYIGRPCNMGGWKLTGSKWANPFKPEGKTKKDYEKCIEKYRKWVLQQPELMESLHELQGKRLGCWCKPLPCHGDILAALANELDEKKEEPDEIKTEDEEDETDEIPQEFFYETDGNFGFLTNFYPFPFRMGGKKYLTTEHYYQAMKFDYPLGSPKASAQSLKYAEIIRFSSTPAKCKALGHQQPHRFGYNWPVNSKDDRKINDIIEEYKNLSPRPDWEERKVKVMYDCLKVKIPTFFDRLPKNTYFVEHTVRDKYWADGGDGRGQNFLGRLITLIVNEKELSKKIEGPKQKALKETIGYEELIEKINFVPK